MFSSNKNAPITIPDNKPDAADSHSLLSTSILSYKDAWACIADRANSPVDVRNMALSCHFLYHSTLPVLRQKKLRALAHWVVAEPTKSNVDKIITAMRYDRSLLFTEVDEVMDGTGHRIIKMSTLYQLAYFAYDFDLALKMEKVYIEHLGHEEAQRVLEEQRNKKMLSEEESKQCSAAYVAEFNKLFAPLSAAIDAEPFEHVPGDERINLRQETLDAIRVFKDGFASSQPREIEKGVHFYLRPLHMAYDIAKDLDGRWNHSSHKLALYEDVVIATLQGFVPTFVAMQISQGLKDQPRHQYPESCNRSLSLPEIETNYYDFVNGNSHYFAGVSGNCLKINFSARENYYPNIHDERYLITGRLCAISFSQLAHFFKNISETFRKLRSKSASSQIVASIQENAARDCVKRL